MKNKTKIHNLGFFLAGAILLSACGKTVVSGFDDAPVLADKKVISTAILPNDKVVRLLDIYNKWKTAKIIWREYKGIIVRVDLLPVKDDFRQMRYRVIDTENLTEKQMHYMVSKLATSFTRRICHGSSNVSMIYDRPTLDVVPQGKNMEVAARLGVREYGFYCTNSSEYKGVEW